MGTTCPTCIPSYTTASRFFITQSVPTSDVGLLLFSLHHQSCRLRQTHVLSGSPKESQVQDFLVSWTEKKLAAIVGAIHQE